MNSWDTYIVQKDTTWWNLIKNYYGEKVYIPSILNTIYLINIREVGTDINKKVSKGTKLVMPPLEFCWRNLKLKKK